MFIRFDVIHERDGQTDGQTLHDSKDRACIASRGNKKSTMNRTDRLEDRQENKTERLKLLEL